MRYWIKLYTEILKDPKMGRLTDRQFRTCINLFALAGEVDQEGVLPTMADISWTLRMSEDDLLSDMQALAKVDILTRAGEAWTVAKWQERQAKAPSAAPDKVLQRVHEHRKRQRNESVTALQGEVKRGVTPPETDTDTETDTETETEKKAATAVSPAWAAFTAARGLNLNPLDEENIGELEDLYGSEAVAQAIRYCNVNKRQGFLTMKYIIAVLSGWQADGTLGNHPEPTNGATPKPAKKRAPITHIIDPVTGERVAVNNGA